MLTVLQIVLFIGGVLLFLGLLSDYQTPSANMPKFGEPTNGAPDLQLFATDPILSDMANAKPTQSVFTINDNLKRVALEQISLLEAVDQLDSFDMHEELRSVSRTLRHTDYSTFVFALDNLRMAAKPDMPDILGAELVRIARYHLKFYTELDVFPPSEDRQLKELTKYMILLGMAPRFQQPKGLARFALMGLLSDPLIVSVRRSSGLISPLRKALADVDKSASTENVTNAIKPVMDYWFKLEQARKNEVLMLKQIKV